MLWPFHGVRIGLLMTLVTILTMPSSEAARKWRFKENCLLIPNPANDGDSFHVKWNTRHYIIRLYYVDAPESDMSIPERVQEQAAYFGISEEDAIRIGKEATKFTEQFLKNGFILYTKFEDARGRSEKSRDYGHIVVSNKYLAEALVENGLARIHGVEEELPDGPSISLYRMRLKGLEADAQKFKRGAWAYAQPAQNRFQQLNPSAPRPAAPLPPSAPVPAPAATTAPARPIVEQTLTITRHVPVYSLLDAGRMVGTLTPGKEITVLREESPAMVRIRFQVGDDKIYEAQCRREDLNL